MSKVSQPPQSQPPPSKRFKHDRSDLRNFLGRGSPRSTAAGGSKEVSHTSPENSNPGSTSNPGLQSRRSQTRPRNSQSSMQLHHLNLSFLASEEDPSSLPPAGRLAHCTRVWASITSDPWVLSAVKGYALELDHQPHQVHAPYQRALSSEAERTLDLEVGKLLDKKAVVRVEPSPGQFVSSVFTVPKKDGSQRLVVNLKPLNRAVSKQRFKMEGAHMLKDLVRKGDWMTSIDAYMSVPIHPPHRKWLRFLWKGQLYEFQCLPFGLSSAPRVFTKILRPVMAVLRRRGIRCIIYIDDLLLLSQSKEELVEITKEVLDLLRLLGFVINWVKSILTPCQTILFLGFVVDSRKLSLILPEDKLMRIQRDCLQTLQMPSLSLHYLARLIGRMAATSQAILPAPEAFNI